MPPMGAYGLVALIAAAGTYLLLFPVRRLATRVGFVAEPDERRIHKRTTPYGGGVSMFVAFLLAMLVASQLHQLQSLFQGSSEPLGLLIGAAVTFTVGTVDDFREMSAPAKIAGEVLAAMIFVYMGLTMFQFKIPTVGFLVLSPDVTPLLTAAWVIVITNAVNLIDGLDGLAAGIVAIASGALAIYGLRLEFLGVLPSDNIGPLIAVIAFGVCIGFLPHNFPPARVFMGDGGALFLGLLMAAATMVIGGRTPDVSGQTFFFFAPLLIPLFILGVPIADLAFAFVRRTARGTAFDTPDMDHLHHRLLRLGHGPRRTVIILWAWTAVLSGFVLYPLFRPKANAIIPFGVIALGLALFTLLHPSVRRYSADALADEEAGGDRTVEEPAAGDGIALGDGAAAARRVARAKRVAGAKSDVDGYRVLARSGPSEPAEDDPRVPAASGPSEPGREARAVGGRRSVHSRNGSGAGREETDDGTRPETAVAQTTGNGSSRRPRHSRSSSPSRRGGGGRGL